MVELRVLGAVDITGVDAQAAHGVLRQPKRLALLTYLAIESRRHFARRDSVLAMFWPESDAERGRHALRQALHMLRRALGNDALERRGDDDVSISRDALQCDAAAFESLLDDGRAADALALYGGELLPAVYLSDAPAFERWLDETRQRLRERAVGAALALERAAEASGDLRAAVTWVRRALSASPHDESAARRLFTYLDRLGDRAAAIEAFDTFAQRLAADLELSPSPETQALIHEVRVRASGSVRTTSSVATVPAASAVAAHVIAPAMATAHHGRNAVAIAVLALMVAVSALAWRLNAGTAASDAAVPPLKSTIARRFYDEAVTAWTRGDMVTAERLSLAAFHQDSTYALALFTYGTLLGARARWDESMVLMRRAVGMTPRQPDHERLLILTWFGQMFSDPRFPLYAETLAIRYPDDLQAQWLLAQGRRTAGEFLAAVAPLRHVISVDRASLRSASRTRCFACRAYPELVGVYEAADSLALAESTAREWIKELPRDPEPWAHLVYQLSIQGRYAEALQAQQRREDLAGGGSDLEARGEILLRAGDFETYEHILVEHLGMSAQLEANDTYWKYWFLLRYQGRMREALALVSRMKRDEPDEALTGIKLFMLGQSYFETGQFAASARLWDSLSNHVPAREPPGQAARFRAWYGVRASDSFRALRDTAALRRLADTIRADGQRSGRAVDRRLYHHVLGLLHEVRGDVNSACDEFRQALFSASPTYPRTNTALGRTCIAAKRPRDAARPLYGALHGPIGQAGTYGTMTEVHELLGALHEALGHPDSARYWYRRAADAWKRADPEWLARPERRSGALRTASSARPTDPAPRVRD